MLGGHPLPIPGQQDPHAVDTSRDGGRLNLATWARGEPDVWNTHVRRFGGAGRGNRTPERTPLRPGPIPTDRAGDPDPARISTSYVERQNLTMRMGMRRFTRLTNGFSKRVENLTHTVSLHYLHYRFARPYSSLGKRTTPAMAGVAEYPWTTWAIAHLLDRPATGSSAHPSFPSV